MSAVRKAIALLIATSLMLATTLSWAWGRAGHRLVAELAEQRMSAPARRELQRLLALEPGETLMSISTWADEVRSPTTAAWHYTNFSRDGDCRYDAAAQCLEGRCVVGAIQRQAAVLGSAASDADRLKALKYISHLVADVHQPLHAGYADDKGGNTLQVQAQGRGTNLHALWDSGLVEHWPGGEPALRAAVARHLDGRVATSPAAWAQASCRIVSQSGFYPARHRLDDQYAQQWRDVVARQLAQASIPLAQLLDDTLAPRRREVPAEPDR